MIAAMTRKLLILGGTREAGLLCQALAGRPEAAPVLSLAGVTREPLAQPVPVRSGGFGGSAGLAAWLQAERVEAVVDATHPFAARMSANAAAACAGLGLPLLRLLRPAWTPEPGDAWMEVGDLAAAVRAIGPEPRRVFVSSGRMGIEAFTAAPQHDYLIRAIDPPAERPDLPRQQWILARGPFTLAAERALLQEHEIQVLVSKNSGGARQKLDAARLEGVRLVMVARPALPEVPTVAEVGAAAAWCLEGAQGSAP